MIGVSSVSEAPFGIFFAIVAAVVLIAAWVILAGSRFIQGGVVERPERVPQLYGYTCAWSAFSWPLWQRSRSLRRFSGCGHPSRGRAASGGHGSLRSHPSKRFGPPMNGREKCAPARMIRNPSSSPRRSCGAAMKDSGRTALPERGSRRSTRWSQACSRLSSAADFSSFIGAGCAVDRERWTAWCDRRLRLCPASDVPDATSERQET